MTARPAPLDKPSELQTFQTKIGGAVPVNQSRMIVSAVACNKASASATIDMWIVADNEIPSAENRVLNAYSVVSNDTVYLPLSGLTLGTGYTVHARADTADAITLFVSVWKITTA